MARERGGTDREQNSGGQDGATTQREGYTVYRGKEAWADELFATCRRLGLPPDRKGRPNLRALAKRVDKKEYTLIARIGSAGDPLANLYRVRISDDERYMRRRGPIPSTGIGGPDSGTPLSREAGQDARGRTYKGRIHKGKEASSHHKQQKTHDDYLCSGCRSNRCPPSCPAQECPDRRAAL